MPTKATYARVSRHNSLTLTCDKYFIFFLRYIPHDDGDECWNTSTRCMYKSLCKNQEHQDTPQMQTHGRICLISQLLYQSLTMTRDQMSEKESIRVLQPSENTYWCSSHDSETNASDSQQSIEDIDTIFIIMSTSGSNLNYTILHYTSLKL